MTEAEYLQRDHKSPSRLDLLQGQIYDIRAGLTDAYGHSLATTRLRIALGNALGEGFRVHGSDLRLGLAGGNLAYADACVETGTPQLRHEESSDTLLNPIAVYEIVDQAEKEYVKDLKLQVYQATPSISEIVLIDLYQRSLQTWTRSKERWGRSISIGLRSRGHLRTLGTEIALDDVFEGVSIVREF